MKLLFQFMCKPDTTSKIFQMTLKISMCFITAPRNTKVSSAYCRWVISRLFLEFSPTSKPLIQLFTLAVWNRLLNPFIANIKRKGDRGSPCLKTLVDGKNPHGFLLIRIENITELMQCLIHFNHLWPKPILYIIFIKKFQFMWSYAFWISSLYRIPGCLSFFLESTHSLAINTASMICLLLIKGNLLLVHKAYASPSLVFQPKVFAIIL